MAGRREENRVLLGSRPREGFGQRNGRQAVGELRATSPANGALSKGSIDRDSERRQCSKDGNLLGRPSRSLIPGTSLSIDQPQASMSQHVPS